MSYNTHGMSKSSTYQSWTHMKDRCLNPNNTAYKYYGFRGIKVCIRWFSFENFLKDLGERPPGTELERLDVNGDYTPLNCVWASKSQNQRNKRIPRNNQSGISGVHFAKGLYWVARGKLQGRTIHLYNGKDFFLACCARKSWEVQNVSRN